MAGIGHDRGRLTSGAVPQRANRQGLAPEALRVQSGAHSAQELPHFGASRSAMRDRIKAWLRAQGLPRDAVLMIGETEHQREMMTARGLAGFLAGQRFFAGVADAV